ncbi:hypothetical protein [Methylobacterium crusticola]|uniref:hypothetical protein n=1 Tax=Methylobacterium crusticola TaxID=1697972 RepID=UPI000FFB63F6|nr:hypothetical protein [Methylobacterium crusticola]
MTKRTTPFSPEVRERAVRRVRDHEGEHGLAKQPARTHSDAALMTEIQRVFEANVCASGARKVRRRLARQGCYPA